MAGADASTAPGRTAEARRDRAARAGGPRGGDRRGGRNAVLVAKREYSERVGSRAFLISTLLLVGLAIVVSP